MRSYLLVKVFSQGEERYLSPPFLDLFGKLLVFASLGAYDVNTLPKKWLENIRPGQR